MQQSDNSETHEFHTIVSLLKTEEIAPLLALCQLYSSSEIDKPDYFTGEIFGLVIDKIKTFNIQKYQAFTLFLSGVVLGLDKRPQGTESEGSQDIFILNGQNTINNKVADQNYTATTELALNVDLAAIAKAISEGLIEQEALNPIIEAIGNRLEKTSNHNKPSSDILNN